MKDKKDKILIIFVIFLFLISTSIVYALGSGILVFEGSVRYNEVVKADFVDVSISDSIFGEGVSIISGGQVLVFTVRLYNPGDTKEINFRIKNAGNVSVDLDEIKIADITGLNITGPDLNGVIVGVGQTVPYAPDVYTLTVEWDIDYPLMPTYLNIYAEIEYKQTP